MGIEVKTSVTEYLQARRARKQKASEAGEGKIKVIREDTSSRKVFIYELTSEFLREDNGSVLWVDPELSLSKVELTKFLKKEGFTALDLHTALLKVIVRNPRTHGGVLAEILVNIYNTYPGLVILNCPSYHLHWTSLAAGRDRLKNALLLPLLKGFRNKSKELGFVGVISENKTDERTTIAISSSTPQ